MFLDLLLTPITAPISGVNWIAEKILERADAELDDKENLSKRLLALQLAFDMGDISEEEFEVQEEELLLAIQTVEDEARAAAEEDA
ncbi:MAG: gas vesicle protein GvpG [Oculatellaceae cyanobacterium bins.114]|nr:gas vesicle protein GvpG [Oculatellaceae cyanobacterium bins.114]